MGVLLRCTFYRWRVKTHPHKVSASRCVWLDDHSIEGSCCQKPAMGRQYAAQQPAGVDGAPGAPVVEAFVHAGRIGANSQNPAILLKADVHDVREPEGEDTLPGIPRIGASEDALPRGNPEIAIATDGDRVDLEIRIERLERQPALAGVHGNGHGVARSND